MSGDGTDDARAAPPERWLELADEAATAALGARLAARLPRPALVTLEGDLGTGKSVLARALLRALGHTGAVPSPTYAIVESYDVPGRRVAHLDLYRLADPGELYDLGFEDVLAAHDTLLVEWPERGGAMLPPADVAIRLEHAGGDARRARLRERAPRGAEGPPGP